MNSLPERTQIGWQVFVRRPHLVEYFSRREVYLDLVRFDALCADCGKPFVAMATKSNWRARRLRRRCDQHVRLGIPVDNLKPPIKVANMPAWARPVAALIKRTAARKRYATVKAKPPERPAEPVLASKAPAARQRPPDLSYLD